MEPHQSHTLITIDRTKPFAPHPFLTKEYGEMRVAWQHELAQKITVFDLAEDVIVIEEVTLRNIPQIIQSLHKEACVPLDAYCAHAIAQSDDLLRVLREKWHYWRPRLNGFVFVGTLLSQVSAPKYAHVITFRYLHTSRYYPRPQIELYEAQDRGWGEHDPVLVFNRYSTRIRSQLAK